MSHLKIYKILYLSIFLTILLRLPFIHIPFFIADEAQLMTFGEQLIRGGIYGIDVVDTRGPGGYYLVGIFNYLFGYGNMVAYRMVSIAYQIIIILLIYKLGALLFNKEAASYSCLFYSIFSYSYLLHDTLAFNVETIALPFILGSAILFWHSFIKRLNNGLILLLIGLVCALTFAIKQVLAGSLAVFIFFIFWGWKLREIKTYRALYGVLLLIIGFVTGFLAIFGKSIVTTGINNTFYWMIIYASKHYYLNFPTRVINFLQRIFLYFINQPLFWTLGFMWVLLFINRMVKRQENNEGLYLLLLMVAQLVGVIIAGHVVGHYIIPGLAIMSLMVGDLCCNVINFIKSIGISYDISLRYLIISIILIGFVPPLLKYTLFPEGIEVENYSLRAFFYEKLCQKEDPLSKVINIVKQNTSTQDHIYVLGRLYELYPLTKRLPATVANGMDWYRDRDGDSFLVKNYNAIINSLRRQPPKVIILPCPIYRGIDLDQGPWEEIRNILREDYLTPKRLEWNSRMKFLTGKSGLVANVHEWVDVYFRK